MVHDYNSVKLFKNPHTPRDELAVGDSGHGALRGAEGQKRVTQRVKTDGKFGILAAAYTNIKSPAKRLFFLRG